MMAIALISYALLAFLRPRIALGVLLFFIPFGHLVRFSVAGVPFTFVEAGTYLLVGALALQHFFSSFRASSEKSHTEAGASHSVRSLGSGLGMTNQWRDTWVILPLLWLLIAALSAAYSPNALRAWGIWKAYFLAPVILFWVVRAVLHPPLPPAPPSPRGGEGGYGGAGFRTMMVPLALGAFVVAAIAILQRWWPVGVPYPWSIPGKFRATSVFGYPNAVGLYLAPLVPLLVGVSLFFLSSFRASREPKPRAGAWREKSRMAAGANNSIRSLGFGLGMTRLFYSLFLLLTSAIAIVAIALARSTGALVALAVVLPVLIILLSWHFHTRTPSPPSHLGAPDAHSYDRRNRRLANGWAAGLIGAWVVASLLLTLWLPNQREQPKWGPPIVQKLTFQQWSGSVRLAQYRETWALLRNHPIRGAGLAGYQREIAPYHEDARVEIFLYPHNLLLAIWVELGLAGLLVFLAILYKVFCAILSSPPTGRGSEGGWGLRFGIAALLVILIHGLVDVPYFKNDLAMVFWVMVAMVVIMNMDSRHAHQVR